MGPVDVVLGVGHEARGQAAGHHRRVVRVGRENPVWRVVRGIPNHGEERVGGGLPVDGPIGVENFVSAMFGVGLGEHHEFDVAGVPAQVGKARDQVVDFVLGQGQPQFLVGLNQGLSPAGQDVDFGQGERVGTLKKLRGVLESMEDGLGHAVVDQRGDDLQGAGSDLALDPVGDPALQAIDGVEAADMGDIRGLGRPGGEGADAGHDEQEGSLGLARLAAPGPVAEQLTQHVLVVGAEGRGGGVELDEMREVCAQTGDFGCDALQGFEQRCAP